MIAVIIGKLYIQGIKLLHNLEIVKTVEKAKGNRDWTADEKS